MKGYKEIIISVPENMKYLSVDESGEVYVSTEEPVYKSNRGKWTEGGDWISVGSVPKPKNPSKELYRI